MGPEIETMNHSSSHPSIINLFTSELFDKMYEYFQTRGQYTGALTDEEVSHFSLE